MNSELRERGYWGCVLGTTQADRRNNLRFTVLSLAWAVVYVGVAMTQRFLAPPAPWSWIVAFLPAIPAILAVAAYLKFLREADEMVRTIQLQGLAYGFATGVLVRVGMQLPMELNRALARTDFVLTAMMLGWAAGVVIATRRYK